MAQQPISQGPGNNVPETETRFFKCAATVTKGFCVALSGYTAVAALVVTHGDGSYINGTTIEGGQIDELDVGAGSVTDPCIGLRPGAGRGLR